MSATNSSGEEHRTHQGSRTLMRFIAGFLIALVLVVLAQLVIISSGAYDIAATRDDSHIEQWLLSTTMKRSVARRADEVTVPQAFTEEQVQHGFRGFKEMCEPCHGAPGKKDSEVRTGMNPRPPDLAESARHWNRAQLFWIIKYGVRMTGMPAFGLTHEEPELWNLVAFVEQLPQIDAERYRRLEEELGDASEQHDH